MAEPAQNVKLGYFRQNHTHKLSVVFKWAITIVTC